ncbi:MAG: prolipoprotein diacylglyceryl transferase [Peptoniphilaceae bacterium]|nr:prolipoprotein diacylglyceryl transferase [Peptoniphilaceae bacterium]MDY3076096.1 prolipoprotein diacylglyceryl transferase [Peptoniphilaceae bacterium]
MFEYTGDGVAFSLFGIEIRWYAIMIVTGMFLAVLLATRESKKRGYGDEVISDLALWMLPIAVIGARIWYVIFEPQRFSTFLDVINIRSGGLAIQGGIMASLIVIFIFSRRRELPFFELTDLIAPGLALAQSIGRWGNFFNNEAYGYPTNVPWAVLIQGEPHHPTFFYESAGDFLIFLVLLIFLRRSKKINGRTTMLYFVLYGILRFFVEGLRTDSLYFGHFRVAQILSLCGIGIGILGFFILSTRARKEKDA